MGTINGRTVTVANITTVLQAATAATGNGTSLALIPGDEVLLRTVGATVPSFTVTYEISFDSGSTWEAISLSVLGSLAAAATAVIASTTPINASFTAPPGATTLRARVSTYVSGTCTVTAYTRRLGG